MASGASVAFYQLGRRARRMQDSVFQECPRCRLTSPPGALRCDCGYDFNTGKMERSFVVADAIQRAGGAGKLLQQAGTSNMRTGAILFFVGAGITALAYLLGSIQPGPGRQRVYFWFWGAMAFGSLQFLRGLDQYLKGRRLFQDAGRSHRDSGDE